jgi:hypothetical protein
MNDERLMSDLAEIAEHKGRSPSEVFALQVEAAIHSYVRQLEPTEAMIHAGIAAMTALPQSEDAAQLVRAVWQAMVQVA